jgi:hypothetical protein
MVNILRIYRIFPDNNNEPNEREDLFQDYGFDSRLTILKGDA